MHVAWHPHHPWPRRGLRQSPLLQPSHEHAALRTLGHDDVGRERSKVVIGGLVAHNERHVHRLCMMGCHVPRKSGLRRIVARCGRPRSDPHPRGNTQRDSQGAGGEHRRPTRVGGQGEPAREIGQRRGHQDLYYALLNCHWGAAPASISRW